MSRDNRDEVYDLTEESGITSSIEAMMAERIYNDERAGKLSFFERFSEVHFDEKTRGLRLASLRELWKDGFAMKRYMEYPCACSSNLDKVFEEIDFYLQKGDLVIRYIDRESVCEGMNWITGIHTADCKINFRTMAFNGEVLEESLTYEAYCKRFLTFRDNNSRVRFDIYQPLMRMKRDKQEIDPVVLGKNLIHQKISPLCMISCLFHVRRVGTVSRKVLCEWFQIFKKYEHYLQEEGCFNDACVESREENLLFSMDSEQNGFIHMFQLIRGYNRILDRTRKRMSRR